jgi:hypothetical protein
MAIRIKPPLEPLIERYLNGIAAATLGQELGVSGDTVLAWFRKAGVAVRTKREAARHPVKRALLAEKARGRVAWNKGLTRDDPRVAAYADKFLGRKVSVATRARISASRTKYVWYNTCQECNKPKGYSKRLRCCLCAARYRAKKYPNPMTGRHMSEEHKLKMIAANKGQRAPTKPELKTISILNHMFGTYNPYRYTGYGEKRFWLRIGDKVRNPDFTSLHLRKIIEVFGRYWHPPEDEHKAITDYAFIGWTCLVLWEDDECFVDRIMYFTYPEEYRAEREDTSWYR